MYKRPIEARIRSLEAKMQWRIYIKSCIFLGSLAFCLFEVQKCVARLLDDPSTTVISFEEFGHHGVPSATVCPHSDHRDTDQGYRHNRLQASDHTPDL